MKNNYSTEPGFERRYSKKDLETRKKEFVQEFLKIRDEEIIARLKKTLRNENERSVQDNSEPMSVEEFNLKIDQSMDDFRRGKRIKATNIDLRI